MNHFVAVFTVVIVTFFLPVIDPNNPSAFNDSNRQERSRVQRQRFKRRPLGSNSDQSVTKFVSDLMKNYNKQEPPMPDRATLVSLGIYVISFYSISEQTMDYSVSMYLRQSWTDPRLQFPKYPKHRKKMEQIRLGDGMWNEIWIPDTFLRNEKAANFHLVTVENRMLQLKASGNLWYVTKITATLSCPMFLQKFPLDTQVCPMLFESFGYTMDTLYFQPMPKELGQPVEVAGDLQLPQFLFLKSDVHDCSQNYTTGAYPCLEFRFFLRRDLGYFLIQVYVPSILIVILSWVSFWINVDASPARVSIGLLTVLTTTTMSSGARATLPRVSYIKAIDMWMIICLLFVFLSLIEYAVVNVLARKPARLAAAAAANAAAVAAQKRRTPSVMNHHQQQQQRVPKREPAHGAAIRPIPRKTMSGLNCFKINMPDHHPAGGASVGGVHMSSSGGTSDDGKAEARRVDKIARKIFPTTFVIFNIIYWVVYTEPFSRDPLDELTY